MIRRPVSAASAIRNPPPRQGVLTLDAPLPSVRPASRRSGPQPPRARVSHEVILSRMLAGMIDLLLPLVIGGIFGLVGARLLGLDFFSESSLRLILLLSLCFFFLNSFFFLLLSGQTPGMYWTDLELIGDRSEAVPLGSLALRILLFLPAVASLIGLLLGLSDPWRRCLHDRLSGTRVVPGRAGQPAGSSPSTRPR